MTVSNPSGSASVRVDDRILRWAAETDRRNDSALGAAAQDVEMTAVFKVPVDEGKLARYIRKRRISGRHWEVRVDLPYAAYQERGRRADGSHVVRRYSRPGSGPHYLKNAGDLIRTKFASYFTRAQSVSHGGSSSGRVGSTTNFFSGLGK